MIEKGSLEDSFIVFHPSALGHKRWDNICLTFVKREIYYDEKYCSCS